MSHIGSGQVAALGEAMMAQRIGLTVVEPALSPVQQRNLKRAWNCKVIDRTGLIPDIFGERARMREGWRCTEIRRQARWSSYGESGAIPGR